MKKCTAVFVFCVLCFGISLFAQTESTLESLLERLQENHMGRVSDVFTLEERQILRKHFSNLSINTENPERGPAVYVHGIENINMFYGNFDIQEPEDFMQISLSPLIEFEGAGAWDYNALDFKVIDNLGGLYRLSLTGTYNFEANLTPPTGESFTGMEYDYSTGILYGLSTDGAGSSTLSTIDPVGGTVTSIGNTGITLPINLAIDNASVGYTIGIDGNFSYRINLATADATPLGDIGFDANFGQGMTYEPNTDVILMAAYNNDTFQSELRYLDTSTGMTTMQGLPLGSWTPGGTTQFGWVGSPADQLTIGDYTHSGFSFYPNPASDILTLKANDLIKSITIYNLLGQKVMVQDINALKSNINISNLASGYYILQTIINEQFKSYKLIKQ